MKKKVIQNGKREKQAGGKYKEKVIKQEGWNGKIQSTPIRTPRGETREDGKEAFLKNALRDF